MSNKFRSGFAALIGRPNVGKSTLMNHLVGQKVAIMSDKAQTTRNRIRGVLTEEDYQIIFLDTPGIHKPRSKLGEQLVKTAQDTLYGVDLILFLIDATEGMGSGDQFIIENLKNLRTPVYLVINKIDQVHPEELLPIIDKYRQRYAFKEVIPISALHGNNTSRLIDLIVQDLPEGPQFYPSDTVTDHPERFIASEIIREKVLQLTKEEIPHSVAVVIEEMKLRDHKQMMDIHATIFTERNSQKGILIGKNGSLLKEVGQRARRELETLLGYKIYLDLWIKVKKDWRNEELVLRQFGFHDQE